MTRTIDIRNFKKILIIGESGRGKSTLARKLADRFSLPLYSTDDFFWKTKFTEPNDRQKSIIDIKSIYATDMWIVEGSSNHLIVPGLERADVIINLVFRNIFAQWWSLIKRNQVRGGERIFSHLAYVAKKRFGIGNDKEKRKREALKPYTLKIVTLRSYGQIDRLLLSKTI